MQASFTDSIDPNDSHISQNPFEGMTIDEFNLQHLYVQERIACDKCGKGYKIFCPQCAEPLGHTPVKVKLPLPVDIYRDPREVEGKSTSVHARLVAPESVTIKVENIVKEPEATSITQYAHPERILLLFPSEEAVPLADIPGGSFERLVVLDGTWKQGRAMAKVAKKHNFRHVAIRTRRTLFWRYQPFGENHLSTIEAIYWFFRDYHDAYFQAPYEGQFDNLLFYFKWQWNLIQNIYRTDTTKRFTSRKLDGAKYIRYDHASTESPGCKEEGDDTSNMSR